jgi:stearoyl-CoA desaturase (delta-9 desaturase)
MGLLLTSTPEAVIRAEENISIKDLEDDYVVMFQYNLYPWWNIFWCFVIPTLYGKWRLGSYFDGFLIFGVLRWILSFHSTCCVNSVAHFFGYKPYNDNPPTESWITSFIAVGEGWHNYHHQYPYDYATSEFGILQLLQLLQQWNPTKLFIDIMYHLGLAYDLKQTNTIISI